MTQALTLKAAALWREYPREAIGLGLLGAAAATALAGAAYSNAPGRSFPNLAAASANEPPAPPPLLVRKLAPQDALSLNQQIPIANGPNPEARPFPLRGDAASRARALECLTSAIYYEAGNESGDGQRAVAQVVLNRVRHPAFPKSVCGVVYEGSTRITGCQFTFTCDGSLARRPSAHGWLRAQKVAQAALAGAVFAPVGYATHYHANYVVPYWASSLAKNAVMGAHIFYRWAGSWGKPKAFENRYAGMEPNSESLRIAALAAEAAEAKTKVAETPADVAAVVAEIPGAEVKKAEPGQVRVRFSLAARKAVEEAPRQPYAEKFEVSDNLRWTLGSDTAGSKEKPFGKAAPAPSTSGASGGGATAPQL
jgi:spore germination cell wall hydrolase CwlJ-like protein